MHTPVLLKEAIEALNIKKGGKYIDATFGEEGHSREIIKRGGKVLAIDWDEDNVNVKSQLSNVKGLKLVWGNFADIEKIAKENQFYPADGILFDLGLSMEQIGKSGRGFSYKRLDEPLDMRISRQITRNAADLVNSSSASELYEIFAGYSQEINSRAIAAAIFRAARIAPIMTVADLNSIIGGNEGMKRRIYQAIRMAINNEITNIKKGLIGAARLVTSDGRIVVISFHQTEDRVVKLVAREEKLRLIVKKPITAHSDNPFERSAKLRILTV